MDGSRLRRLRKAMGFKDAARFCIQFGFSTSTLQYWEESKREPKITNFLQLANAFGMSLDELAVEVGLISAPKQRPAIDVEWALFLRESIAAGWTPDDARLGLRHVALSRPRHSEEAAAREARPKRGSGAG